MAIELTYDETVKILREVVAEKGEDYVYPGAAKNDIPGARCKYFENDGTPSCIVGHVLARYGLTLEELTDVHNAWTTPAKLLDLGLISTTPRVIELLAVAQGKQDFGSPWRVALDNALSRTEGLND